MSNLPDLSPIPEEPRPIKVSILDEKDPTSIVNLLPNKIRGCVLEAARLAPHLFLMDEESFIKYHKERKIFFNATDKALRTQFWIEYHQVRASRRPAMRMSNILATVCSKELFYKHYVRAAHRVAWLCVMPLHYHRTLENHLSMLTHDMTDIIERPLTDPSTKMFDMKLAQMKINLFKMIEATLHGSPTQRIDQRVAVMQVSKIERTVLDDDQRVQRERQLKQRILELERAEREAQHLPSPQQLKAPVVDGIVNRPPSSVSMSQAHEFVTGVKDVTSATPVAGPAPQVPDLVPMPASDPDIENKPKWRE